MAKILLIGWDDEACVVRMTRDEFHSTFAAEKFENDMECTPLVKSELIHALQRALGRVEVAAKIIEDPKLTFVEVKE